jgi:uncharacterized membrane protein
MLNLPTNLTRFRNLSDKLRGGYWFLPMIMAILAVAAAGVLLTIDRIYFSNSAVEVVPETLLDTASFRSLATLVASSTLAFLGVLFSVILVPLSIAANQLGPPVMRTFLRNTGTQIVLGLFIGNIFFSLTLLASVPEWRPRPPALSSLMLLMLFLLSIAALLYFINEVAHSLQANTVITRLAAELESDIRLEIPRKQSTENDYDTLEAQRKALLVTGHVLRAKQEGYIRAIDYDGLIKLAASYRTVMATAFQPGDFIMRGDKLVCVPASSRVDEALEAQVNRQFLLGDYRTITQDIDFGLLALVSVAVRALSPAINDPFTAMLCLQRLGAALAMIAERGENIHHFRDKEGVVRLLGEPDTFDKHTNLCFHQIRQYGQGSTEVLIAMLRVISRVAERTRSETQRNALRLHADLIDRQAHAGSLTEYDATRVRIQYERTIEVIDHHSKNHKDEEDDAAADDAAALAAAAQQSTSHANTDLATE